MHVTHVLQVDGVPNHVDAAGAAQMLAHFGAVSTVRLEPAPSDTVRASSSSCCQMGA